MLRQLTMLFMAGAIFSGIALADEATLPGSGWKAVRYETLWTKSPFSVATPEVAQGSVEYSLWGIGKIEGISFASLTEKQSNEHFLLTSDKPVRGLTLVSIKRGNDASTTQAVIQKDGQSIVLKLEQGQATAPMAGGPQPNMQQPPPPIVQMPGLASGGLPPPPQADGVPPGAAQAAPAPPFAIRRPPVIHLPQHPPPGP